MGPSHFLLYISMQQQTQITMPIRPHTSLVGNHWPGGTRGALRCRCDADSTDDSRAMRAPPPRA